MNCVFCIVLSGCLSISCAVAKPVVRTAKIAVKVPVAAAVCVKKAVLPKRVCHKTVIKKTVVIKHVR